MTTDKTMRENILFLESNFNPEELSKTKDFDKDISISLNYRTLGLNDEPRVYTLDSITFSQEIKSWMKIDTLNFFSFVTESYNYLLDQIETQIKTTQEDPYTKQEVLRAWDYFCLPLRRNM